MTDVVFLNNLYHMFSCALNCKFSLKQFFAMKINYLKTKKYFFTKILKTLVIFSVKFCKTY